MAVPLTPAVVSGLLKVCIFAVRQILPHFCDRGNKFPIGTVGISETESSTTIKHGSSYLLPLLVNLSY